MSEYIIDAGVGEWDSRITDQTYDSDWNARDDYYGVCVGKITRCKDCRYFEELFRACNNDRLVEANGGVLLSVDPDGFCSQAEPKEGA